MAKKDLTRPEYLTVLEAAHLLHVPKSYIYSLINSGDIPAYRLSDRKTYLIRSELDAYIRTKQI